MARGKRRSTYWLGYVFNYEALSVGSTTVEMVPSSVLHAVSEEPTIIRIVGRLYFTFERNEFQESQRSDLYFGITCQHEDVPVQSPRTEIADEHWMWYGVLSTWATFSQPPDRAFDANTIIPGSTGDGRVNQHIPNVMESTEFDARSMRKAPQPCAINMHFQLDERLTATGPAHKLTGFLRFLVKE